jgi:hypothetical protein
MSSIEDPGLPRLAPDSGADTFLFKQDLCSDLPLMANWFPRGARETE